MSFAKKDLGAAFEEFSNVDFHQLYVAHALEIHVYLINSLLYVVKQKCTSANIVLRFDF